MLSITGMTHFGSLDCSFQDDVCTDKCMSSMRSQGQGNLAADAAACQIGDEHVTFFDTVNQSRVSQLCGMDAGET